MVTEKPSIETVWSWLAGIPDPEIPAITLTDLGVIRDVKWVDETLQITVTPTYSGCPATKVINYEVETCLRGHGVESIDLRTQIAPAWTTDWMTAAGRRKLEAYGIAPPQASGAPKRCPQCQSNEVVRVSQFGSTPCKAQWRCTDCLEPFEYFKCI